MPGGRQESGELLPSTVCCEVAEEMGILTECKELLFVIEGLHGEKFHRVDLIFFVIILVKFQMPNFKKTYTR